MAIDTSTHNHWKSQLGLAGVALVIFGAAWFLLLRTIEPNPPKVNYNLPPEQEMADLKESKEMIETFTSVSLPTDSKLLQYQNEVGVDEIMLFKVSVPSRETKPWVEQLKGSPLMESYKSISMAAIYPYTGMVPWWDVSSSTPGETVSFSNSELNRQYTVYIVPSGNQDLVYVAARDN